MCSDNVDIPLYIIYNYDMKTGGRPRLIADLPREKSTLYIRKEFYDAIDSMTWSQREALRRSLNMSRSAIHWGWKKHERFPQLQIALRVIEWKKEGCPITTEKRTVSFTDL